MLLVVATFEQKKNGLEQSISYIKQFLKNTTYTYIENSGGDNIV